MKCVCSKNEELSNDYCMPTIQVRLNKLSMAQSNRTRDCEDLDVMIFSQTPVRRRKVYPPYQLYSLLSKVQTTSGLDASNLAILNFNVHIL